jgi:hypothetical protein
MALSPEHHAPLLTRVMDAPGATPERTVFILL